MKAYELSQGDEFLAKWPVLRRKIESLRLKALRVYLTDLDYYGDGLRWESDRGPNMEQVHGALLGGAEGGELARLLSQVQSLADTIDIVDSFPMPSQPQEQVVLLLGVIEDLLDTVSLLLDPWLSGKDRPLP